MALKFVLKSIPHQESWPGHIQARISFASSFQMALSNTGILFPPSENPTLANFAPSNFTSF